jgi:hypothetical protein
VLAWTIDVDTESMLLIMLSMRPVEMKEALLKPWYQIGATARWSLRMMGSFFMIFFALPKIIPNTK